MIHISPCGWYCFTCNNNGWILKETQDKTTIRSNDKTSVIELLGARKSTAPVNDEVQEFQEDFLKQERILPFKTIVSENTFRVKYYVTKGTDMDKRSWIISHAFWDNYCVLITFHGLQTKHSNPRMQLFYDILSSLQPLVNC
ncbi:MAG: hypothetical protein HQK83_02970 [Fibrobacteria bacterium]|nr:hypothetical protein [Fibrobacteria bacterium]